MYITMHVSTILVAVVLVAAVGLVCLTFHTPRERQGRSALPGLSPLRKPVRANQDSFYDSVYMLKPLLWRNTTVYCVLFGGSALGDAIFQEAFGSLLKRYLEAQKTGNKEAPRLRSRLEVMIRAATGTKCGGLVDEELQAEKVAADFS